MAHIFTSQTTTSASWKPMSLRSPQRNWARRWKKSILSGGKRKSSYKTKDKMKKLALLSVVLLIATAFAQTKTDESGCATASPEKLAQLQAQQKTPAPTLSTWKVTNDGAFTAQYDTSIWKEV